MYILDTDVVSELRKIRSGKGNPNVATWVESVEPVETFLSSITIHELELGILFLERKDAKQGAILRAWFDTRVLPEFDERIFAIDLAVARRCAKLHVPDPRPLRDSFVAATALVHGMIVVTRNVNDFKPMGADVLNPWEFAP
jgi:toxin FitB